jgi:hypothetical protein
MNSYPSDWTEDDIVIHLKMQELYRTNKQLIITRQTTWEDGTPIEPPLFKRQDGYYTSRAGESQSNYNEEKKEDVPPQSVRKDN